MPCIEAGKREILYPALKDRCNTLANFAQGFFEVMNAPQSYDEKMRSKLDEVAVANLESLFNGADSQIWESAHNMESYLHDLATQRNIKIGKLMPTLRCALLGKSGGIGVFEALIILGQKESLERINAFLRS